MHTARAAVSWGLENFHRRLTLKLERMTMRPPFSGPSMFSAGILTLSKVM